MYLEAIPNTIHATVPLRAGALLSRKNSYFLSISRSNLVNNDVQHLQFLFISYLNTKNFLGVKSGE